MGKIYMVRHGKAAAGWDGAADPGLDPTGHAQAEAVAQDLTARLASSVAVYTSPLKRCRETAKPLATMWQTQAIVEPRVAEIPSPIEDLVARTEWLRRVMAGSWADLSADPESGGQETDLEGHERGGPQGERAPGVSVGGCLQGARGADPGTRGGRGGRTGVHRRRPLGWGQFHFRRVHQGGIR